MAKNLALDYYNSCRVWMETLNESIHRPMKSVCQGTLKSGKESEMDIGNVKTIQNKMIIAQIEGSWFRDSQLTNKYFHRII